MYAHPIRSRGWSVFLLVCAAFGAGILWRLTPARQTSMSSSVAEAVSSPSPKVHQNHEPSSTNHQAALNPGVGDQWRLADSDLDLAAARSRIPERQVEVLIAGDPMRIVLANSQVDRPLVVRVKPGAAVTFTAPDSGQFPNGEAAITVTADGRGLAATEFSVTNVGEYRVLATSPEFDGRAQFIVHCVTRKFRDDLDSGRYARQYLAGKRAADEQRSRANARVEKQIRRKESSQ